jgi:hypothetical protein
MTLLSGRLGALPRRPQGVRVIAIISAKNDDFLALFVRLIDDVTRVPPDPPARRIPIATYPEAMLGSLYLVGHSRTPNAKI